MTARRKPVKPKPWTPPAGLKIEVGAYRGDVSLKAEASVGDAVHVAALLVAMLREVGRIAPDTLPFADSVPGTVLPYDWSEEYAGGHTTRPTVGFRAKG